jgi:predicted DNA-binding protein (MmcQ/YjbR family)
MDIATLQQICQQFDSVTEDIKWGNHLCFNIGNKMFLVTAPDSIPHSASFKTKPEDFEELCEREGIIPAPYMARHKWVHIDDIGRMDKKEWEHYLSISYQLIFSALPAKTRKTITEQKKEPKN